MSEKELPADWMIKRALEVLGQLFELEEVKKCPLMFKQIIRCAHYIGEHESEQVDPDLLLAREAAAQLNDEGSFPETARDMRGGEEDDHFEISIALHAIKLARERGAL